MKCSDILESDWYDFLENGLVQPYSKKAMFNYPAWDMVRLFPGATRYWISLYYEVNGTLEGTVRPWEEDELEMLAGIVVPITPDVPYYHYELAPWIVDTLDQCRRDCFNGRIVLGSVV